MRAFGIVMLIAAVVAGALVVWPRWSENRYVDRNMELLRTLPVYPGATQVGIESSPYYFRESGPPIGYGTRATFEAPGVTTEELLVFFEENLSAGWTTSRETFPCISLDGSPCSSMTSLQAVSGSAFVGVDPANLTSGSGSYDVYVDHDSYLAEQTPASVPAVPTPTQVLR